MTDPRLRLSASALVALLALSAFSAFADEETTVEPAGDDPFPVYESIQGNVDFWIAVFSEWDVAHVVVHDLEYPAVIYEVVPLPGAIEERYTEQQKAYIEALRESWEDYLLALEKKVSAKKPLDDVEKEWAVHIATTVGVDGLTEAHERVRTQRGMRERFRAGLERSFRYEPRIREILREAQLPEDLAFMPHVESSFQYHARSSAGATGLWQFTRGTGRRYLTINSSIDERLDPIAATRGAADYLRDAHERLGNWPLAITSYNHGVQGIKRAVERHGADFDLIYREYDGRLFGFASKNFYAEFLAARVIAREPDRFFPEGYDPEPPLEYDELFLERRMTPGGIARAYGVPIDELTPINPAWSDRAVRRGLAIPAGTAVWLPEGTLDRLAGSGSSSSRHSTERTEGPGQYVVRPGNTLSGISKTFGVPLRTLRQLNAMEADDSLIRVGQRLHLGAEPPVEKHVVQRGQTLSEIAQSYGVGLRALREANGIPSRSSTIRVGQTLKLPPGAVRSVRELKHVVRRGETLSEIARSYGISLRALREANGLSSRSSVIRVGQKLRLPQGAVPRVADRRHVVRRGETLLRIASRYGVRLTDLLKANTLSIHSIIRPGQTIRIPSP